MGSPLEPLKNAHEDLRRCADAYLQARETESRLLCEHRNAQSALKKAQVALALTAEKVRETERALNLDLTVPKEGADHG